VSGLLPLLFERVDPRNERRDYGDGFQLRSRELRNQVVSVCSRLIVGNAVLGHIQHVVAQGHTAPKVRRDVHLPQCCRERRIGLDCHLAVNRPQTID